MNYLGQSVHTFTRLDSSCMSLFESPISNPVHNFSCEEQILRAFPSNFDKLQRLSIFGTKVWDEALQVTSKSKTSTYVRSNISKQNATEASAN